MTIYVKGDVFHVFIVESRYSKISTRDSRNGPLEAPQRWGQCSAMSGMSPAREKCLAIGLKRAHAGFGSSS